MASTEPGGEQRRLVQGLGCHAEDVPSSVGDEWLIHGSDRDETGCAMWRMDLEGRPLGKSVQQHTEEIMRT